MAMVRPRMHTILLLRGDTPSFPSCGNHPIVCYLPVVLFFACDELLTVHYSGWVLGAELQHAGNNGEVGTDDGVEAAGDSFVCALQGMAVGGGGLGGQPPKRIPGHAGSEFH